jgi:peptide/nickel transport system permease protein
VDADDDVAAELQRLVQRRRKPRQWQRFRRHRPALFGSALLVLIIAMAVMAPLLSRADPNRIDLASSVAPPSWGHPLGTDRVGRDVWARLVYASRVSVSVGIVAVSIYVAIGMILGSISGYFGGLVDDVVQRLTETVMTFPSLIIIITVVSLVGPSIYNVFLAIGLLGWPGVCRLVRAEVLSLREREFVLAARGLGVPSRRIVLRHIMPNVLAPILVAATLGVAAAILTETSLSFLGLGVQAPTPSWGNMMSDATSPTILENAPWLWLPPGLAIALCVISINFIGDGLRDAFDPRMSL